jgi:hypothetical protein
LEGFLRDNNLLQRFVSYAESAAAEENAENSALAGTDA